MALVLAGCAATSQHQLVRPTHALPTAAEVRRYVSSHWPDMVQTFARFVNRPGETAELIAISDISCDYDHVTPECAYDVTGQFAGEPMVRHRLITQFERDDAGNLVEVLILWHRPPR